MYIYIYIYSYSLTDLLTSSLTDSLTGLLTYLRRTHLLHTETHIGAARCAAPIYTYRRKAPICIYCDMCLCIE